MPNREEKTELPSSLWISWFAAVLVASLTAVYFLFQTFQTKEAANELRDMLDKRLDRIELKIDQLGSESSEEFLEGLCDLELPGGLKFKYAPLQKDYGSNI